MAITFYNSEIYSLLVSKYCTCQTLILNPIIQTPQPGMKPRVGSQMHFDIEILSGIIANPACTKGILEQGKANRLKFTLGLPGLFSFFLSYWS